MGSPAKTTSIRYINIAKGRQEETRNKLNRQRPINRVGQMSVGILWPEKLSRVLYLIAVAMQIAYCTFWSEDSVVKI